MPAPKAWNPNSAGVLLEVVVPSAPSIPRRAGSSQKGLVMNFYIDPHAVANVVAFALILTMCVAWTCLSRRLISALIVLGASLTLYMDSHSDLSLEHIETISLAGVVLTSLLVLVFVVVRARLRRPRARRVSVSQQPRAMEFVVPAEPEPESVEPGLPPIPTRRVVRFPAGSVPVPEPEAQEYQELRRPVRHGSSSRARGSSQGSYVASQRSRARGARLHQ